MVIGGSITVLWDLWLVRQIGRFKAKRRARKQRTVEGNSGVSVVELQSRDPEVCKPENSSVQQRRNHVLSTENLPLPSSSREESETRNESVTAADTITHVIPIKIGVAIIIVFFGTASSLFE